MENSTSYPNPIDTRELAKIIKEKSAARGLKLKDVCEQAGFSSSYIGKWGKGMLARTPSYIEIVQLANILKVPIELLIFGEDYDDFCVVKKSELRGLSKKIQELTE